MQILCAPTASLLVLFIWSRKRENPSQKINPQLSFILNAKQCLFVCLILAGYLFCFHTLAAPCAAEDSDDSTGAVLVVISIVGVLLRCCSSGVLLPLLVTALLPLGADTADDEFVVVDEGAVDVCVGLAVA